jgi:Flp pilus assembly protein TadB
MFVSPYITNFIFLGTCYLSAFQMVQLKRKNPITSIQFIMILFCLVMVITVARMNGDNPWLSLVFFLIAAGCLTVMIRYHRLLPPMKRFE